MATGEAAGSSLANKRRVWSRGAKCASLTRALSCSRNSVAVNRPAGVIAPVVCGSDRRTGDENTAAPLAVLAEAAAAAAVAVAVAVAAAAAGWSEAVAIGDQVVSG